jgi:sn-glycerol 3-phosphate transport system substrate-binding protein
MIWMRLASLMLTIGLLFAPGPRSDAASSSPSPTLQVLRFYFPVGVAGPLAQKMAALVDEFNNSQKQISVEAIYTGDYTQTFQKALTAHLGGNPPDLALITTADVWSLRDAKAIMPLDAFIAEAGGRAFLDQFHEGFLGDVRYAGKIWGLPFQKSTPVFYWNKSIFQEVGLDPEKPPQDWAELVACASKTAIIEGGATKRWGVAIPTDQWLMSAFILQNGGRVNNDLGTQTFLDSRDTIDALQFLADLANKHRVMPPKRLFGDSAQDFVTGQTAMMYNSPGSLTFVGNSAKFPFGVAPLPAGKKRTSPTGGGQLLLFDKIPTARKQAAWKFATWLTSKENSARWMAETGYIAVRKSATEVPVLAKYLVDVPQAQILFEAVKYAQPEAPATHDGRKIAQLMTNALEQALAGKATPEAVLKDAQSKAAQILAQFKK